MIISLLVIVHEYGHFLLAKLNGVEVLEFSVGFGPRLISTTFHKTRYSLKLLPFGGSCRMKSMMEEYDGSDETVPTVAPEGSFESVSCGRRAAILFAGPFFNFLLAFFGAVIIIGIIGYDPPTVTAVADNSPASVAGLAAGDEIVEFRGDRIDIGRDIALNLALSDIKAEEEITLTYIKDHQKQTVSFLPNRVSRYAIGMSYSRDNPTALIEAVSKDSPLEKAGVQAGDVISAIDGNPITTSEALYAYFTEHPLTENAVKLTCLRDGASHDFEVLPYKNEYTTLGFSYNLARQKTSPVGVLKYSLIEMRYWIGSAIKSIGGLFTGLFTVNDLSGPVGIADMVGDAYESSKEDGALYVFLNMLNMIVLLSANLGVMNLLPIPGVDGGRLVSVVIEAIRGKRASWKVESAITTVTALLLLSLMVYVMYHDIVTAFFK